MKSIRFNILHIAFHKLYSFTKFIRATYSDVSAVAFLNLIIFLPLLKILIGFSKNGVIPKIPTWILCLFGGLIFVSSLLYFIKDKYYLQIEVKYSNETIKQKILGNILFILIVVGILLFAFIK